MKLIKTKILFTQMQRGYTPIILEGPDPGPS